MKEDVYSALPKLKIKISVSGIILSLLITIGCFLFALSLFN
jgi:predicted CopG family antitoxin